ncbi:NAD dependent epimerase/dehydratase f [sediment metagenome]|uniref:NAD dependent epimerase/dehydratase f n=1 Tax=sediment metagenome TaxID=749907 RepID=D9PF27_9ZZZZ
MQSKNIILITGSCGFIGFSVAKKLLEDGCNVLGIDSLNSYYDVNLKISRNKILQSSKSYHFLKMDLCDEGAVKKLFSDYSIKTVCHLAAQAGVRYSLTHPLEYKKSNLDGFVNLIEEAKCARVENFVYASSSSVYGDNKIIPFAESLPCNQPVSLYGATKRANEIIAYSYSKLFNLPTTGLRFFTVYGPYGRPDMALFLFTRAILENKPIDVYNYGNMRRSFTYIDDIVSGVLSCLKKPFSYEIFNLGNNKSATLIEYIETIEKKLGITAVKNMLPLQPGDVMATEADLTHVKEKIGFEPKTNIDAGVGKFVDWFRDYYKM